MEEDDFISSHRKARSRHGKEREWEEERVSRGGGIYLWVMHLSLIVRRNYAPPHV